MMQEKLPPFASDAEESVLGSLFISPETLDIVCGLVKPEDFFRSHNGWVYQACLDLYERGQALNVVTVADELSRTGKLEECGGAAYLAHVVSVVPTSLHAEHYARIVQRTSLMRQLIGVAGKIAQMGYKDTENADGTLGQAEELLFELRRAQPTGGFRSLGQVIAAYAEETTAVTTHEGQSIPTGFGDLDAILAGLHAGDLVILAARPGMGKSALLLNIAAKAAQNGIHSGLFSLEMSATELSQRLIASKASIELQALREGRLGDNQYRRVMDTMGELSEWPIDIDDTPGLKIGDIRARAKRLQSQRGLDLLMVDHLGLVNGNHRRENRVQEIGEITRTLKTMAKEMRIPILVAHQLSRAVEQRVPHIPILSDLRDSGEIEQDADVVMFIYREDYYVDEDEWMRKNPTQPYPKGIADVIVAKHRNGPTGQASLLWQEKMVTFFPLDLYRSEY